MKLKFFSIACAAFFGAAIAANAQCPVPGPLSWTTFDGTAILIDAGGNPHPTSIDGAGEFSIETCECATWKFFLKPESFMIRGISPALGQVDLSLDPSRLSTVATRAMNNDGTHTEDFYFYVTMTVAAFPGKTFYSDQELHFQSTSVLTFIPHHNENFSLVSSTNFVDPDTGNIILMLTNADIELQP